jgi:predicted GIY-YIG superfamily endonuclease
MSTTIYVLCLEGGRYYVGKTNDIIERYQQHLNGNGAAWTRKYKPISLVKTIENVSSFEEDKITKEYMAKYGIDKVRGGSYVEIELSEFHIAALKMEIWSAKDLCTQCGRPGHFVKDCYAKTDASGKKIEYEEDSDEEDSDEEDSDEEDEWECEYCERTFTTEFGCEVHEKSCKRDNTKTHYKKQTTNKKEDACYRCGNSGHYSPECYAMRHVKGYYLD